MRGGDFHRLLKRQVKRHFGKKAPQGEAFANFLNSISAAYQAFESDIEHSEGILEQSHKELFQANEALKKRVEQSESRTEEVEGELERVLDSINEIVFQTDHSGNWSYLNKSWKEIFGTTGKRSLGKPFWNSFDGAEKEQLKLEFRTMKEDDLQEFDYVYGVINDNDEQKYVQIKARKQVNKDGIFTGIVGTLNDVTEQYIAEKEIERLSLVARKTANMVILADPEGKITWVNRAFEKISGYTLEEIIGRKPGHLLQGKESDPVTKKELKKAIVEQKTFNGNILNYSKSGVPYWINIVLDPILDELGELEGYIAVESDVSEEIEIRKTTERTNTYLEAVINNIPDAICAFDKNFTVLRGNNQFFDDFTKYFDVEIKEGMNLKEAFDNDWGRWQDLFVTGFKKPVIQTKVLKALSEEEAIFEVQALPIKEKSESVGILLIARDVTKDNLQKNALEESRDQLTKAQEIARLGSFMIGRNGEISLSKQLQFMLQSETESLGVSDFSKAMFPYTPGLLKKIAFSVQSGKKQRRLEHKIQLNDGSFLDLQTVIMDVEDSDKSSYYAWGVSHDISRHKKDQRALEEINKQLESINNELDRFAYVVSHDLKTPLRAIYNLAHFVSEDIKDGEIQSAESKISVLVERTRFMERLIEGILSYSRAGRTESRPNLINTQELINELLGSIKNQRAVRASVYGEWPSIITEEIPLTQVLSNIISNSSKYCDKEELELTLRSQFDRKKNELNISIKDNGPGIAKEYQAKVFELFQTLEGADNTSQGTGIGLALSKRIIQERGGELELISDGKTGTEMKFQWPLTNKKTSRNEQ